MPYTDERADVYDRIFGCRGKDYDGEAGLFVGTRPDPRERAT